MALTGKNKKWILGVTGNMSTGKTYACLHFQDMAKAEGIHFQLIEIDRIRRDILYYSKEARFKPIRLKLIKKLELQSSDHYFSIHGEKLGNRIFADSQAMEVYKKIVNPVILKELKAVLKKARGLILIEWAMLVEDGFLPLIKDEVLLCSCSRKTKLSRLQNSDLPRKQVLQRIDFQGTESRKLRLVKDFTEKAGKRLIILKTDKNPPLKKYRQIFLQLIG